MEDVKTSIIICHHFGDLIHRCLKSLKNTEAEIIVVTNDDKLEIIEDKKTYKITVAKNEPTYKRNLGWICSKGTYLCFIDDDVEIGLNCIKNMETYLDNHSEVGMIYGLLYKMDNHSKIDTSGSFLTWCGFLYETYLDRMDSIPILSGKSALCMIKTDILKELYGFDDTFVIYGEETDLSWRVWLAGYRVMVLPSAIGYHAFETVLKPRSYYNQYYIHYHGCKNYITMLIKNLPARKLYIVLINAFIWFIMAGLMLLKGNRKACKWILQGIWYNIEHFKLIWKKRMKNTNYSYWKYIYKNPSIFYYFNRYREYIIHELHD